MTTKLAGALVAGALAIGILVGAAGTVLVHDPTGPAMGMGDMGQMHQMMGSMMGDADTGPAASMDPVDHAQHHAADDQ